MEPEMNPDTNPANAPEPDPTTDLGTGREFVERLVEATNAHDLDALVACFAADYELTQPVHPARSFTGADQVRANWQQIFGSVPDLHASVRAFAVDGSTLWSEWDMGGQRLDGTPHRMRGVMVFGLRDGCAEWGRFYLEPVDSDRSDVNEAVRRQVHAAPA